MCFTVPLFVTSYTTAAVTPYTLITRLFLCCYLSVQLEYTLQSHLILLFDQRYFLLKERFSIRKWSQGISLNWWFSRIAKRFREIYSLNELYDEKCPSPVLYSQSGRVLPTRHVEFVQIEGLGGLVGVMKLLHAQTQILCSRPGERSVMKQ